MKKKFISPILEIVETKEDVIKTSIEYYADYEECFNN